MEHQLRIADESVLTRWMRIEAGKINGGMVVHRRPLSHLLGAENCSAPTRDGGTYVFDAAVITVLGERIPPRLHSRLRLPVQFIMSPEITGSCWCGDPAAFEALVLLGEISTLRQMEGERFWVSRAIAYAIAGRYPTAIQVVMGT